MDNEIIEFGKKLRAIRRSKKMTQIQLAEKSSMAVNSIRLYEAGKHRASITSKLKLVSALGCDIEELLTESEIVESANSIMLNTFLKKEDSSADDDSISDDYKNKIFKSATRSITVDALDQSVIDAIAYFQDPNIAEFINAIHHYNNGEIIRIMSRIQNMMERIENTERHGTTGGLYLQDDATSVRIATEEWFAYYGSLLGDEIAKAIKMWAMDKFNISNTSDDLSWLTDKK